MEEVRKTPKTSGREQARWAITHVLEDLVGEKAQLWESAERQEALLEEMVSNTKVIADAMDLFMQGERFLRAWEMGGPEGPEETELVVPEGVPEVEPEASCDVEMTLQ